MRILLTVCFLFLMSSCSHTQRRFPASSPEPEKAESETPGIELDVYENPCSGQSGKPFKSYEAFAIRPNETVYKFKSFEGLNFKSSKTSAVNVMEFIKSKESQNIFDQCVPEDQKEKFKLTQIGKFKPDSPGGSTQPPTGNKPSKPGQKPGGNAPIPTSGRDFKSGDTPPVNNPPDFYYGMKFFDETNANFTEPVTLNYDTDSKDQDQPDQKNQDKDSDKKYICDSGLKGRLETILSSKHLQIEGEYDDIAENCPEVKDQNGGVSKKCISQIAYSYKGARTYLFGDEKMTHLKKGFLTKNKEGKYEISLDGKGEEKYYVKDVYCHEIHASINGKSEVGPNKIPFHEYINTEHSWPKSRFNRYADDPNNKIYKNRLPEVSDLHHLYPTDNKHNAYRGNFMFAEISEDSKGHQNSSKVVCAENKLGSPIVPEELKGKDKIDELSKLTYYQVPKDHRGDLARALFYFATRYNMDISAIEEYYLRKWHREDPVDEKEWFRSNRVYELQAVRNPFVDFPNLVEGVCDFEFVDHTKKDVPDQNPPDTE